MLSTVFSTFQTGTINPTVSVTLFNLVTSQSDVYDAPTDLEE